MNKKKLLFILKKKRIPFVNLTVDLKNKKDLDIFIKNDSKFRSENFIYGKNSIKESCQYTRTLIDFFITTKLLKISLSLTFLTKFHLKKVLLQDMFLKLINLKILKRTLK